jgi:anti-sigma B factor antagonist
MHVETRNSGEVVILDLVGKLTAGLGDQILRESIDELLAEGWKRILLNLSGVSFLDSAGLGELVAGLKTARRFGAQLKLLNVGGRVQSTLFMSRLLPVFEIYGNEGEALSSFAAVPPAS